MSCLPLPSNGTANSSLSRELSPEIGNLRCSDEQKSTSKDMSSLLKEVYKVYLQDVDFLRKKCAKLETAKHLIRRKGRELQMRNRKLIEQQTQLKNQIHSLQTKLCQPCSVCHSCRGEVRIQEHANSVVAAEMNLETSSPRKIVSETSPSVPVSEVRSATKRSCNESILSVTEHSSPDSETKVETLPAAEVAFMNVSGLSLTTPVTEIDSSNARVNCPVAQMPELGSGQKITETSTISSRERKDSGSCSSEEKAKALRLARRDRRSKCRYTEEPVLGANEKSSKDDASGLRDTRHNTADVNSTHFTPDKLAMGGSRHCILDGNDHVATPAQRLFQNIEVQGSETDQSETTATKANDVQIVVPETLQEDFVSLSDDSENRHADTAGETEIVLGDQQRPTVDTALSVTDKAGPQSPIFNRSAPFAVPATVSSSPSLFDEEDDQRSVRRKPVESPSLLKPAVCVDDRTTGKVPCDNPGLKLSTEMCTVLSQNSPSVLTGKLEHLAVSDKQPQSCAAPFPSVTDISSADKPSTARGTVSESNLCKGSSAGQSFPSSKANQQVSLDRNLKDGCQGHLSDLTRLTVNEDSVRSQNLHHKRKSQEMTGESETICQLQSTHNCGESLLTEHNAGLADGSVVCDEDDAYSLQPTSVERNGSLAAGVNLSEYNTSIAGTQLLGSRVNQRVTRSQHANSQPQKMSGGEASSRQNCGEKALKRRRLEVNEQAGKFTSSGLESETSARNLQKPETEVSDSVAEQSSQLDRCSGVGSEECFDRVPRDAGANYAYVEVVRKQHLRRQMDGFACVQCEQYFQGMNLSEEELAERLKNCRHKARFAPASTPDHYWSVAFPTTQQCQERGYLGEASNKPGPSGFRRKRGLRKLFESGRQQQH